MLYTHIQAHADRLACSGNSSGKSRLLCKRRVTEGRDASTLKQQEQKSEKTERCEKGFGRHGVATQGGREATAVEPDRQAGGCLGRNGPDGCIRGIAQTEDGVKIVTGACMASGARQNMGRVQRNNLQASAGRIATVQCTGQRRREQCGGKCAQVSM